MAYIVIEFTWPNEKTSQIIETAYEVKKKFPYDKDLVTEVIPGITKLTKDGPRSITILDVKDGKLEAALLSIVPGNNMFSNIEGLIISVDVYWSGEVIVEKMGS